MFFSVSLIFFIHRNSQYSEIFMSFSLRIMSVWPLQALTLVCSFFLEIIRYFFFRAIFPNGLFNQSDCYLWHRGRQGKIALLVTCVMKGPNVQLQTTFLHHKWGMEVVEIGESCLSLSSAKNWRLTVTDLGDFRWVHSYSDLACYCTAFWCLAADSILYKFLYHLHLLCCEWCAFDKEHQ